jgi:hypothetical protein
MKDNVNDGGTRYVDKEGKELTEQECVKLLKKARGHDAVVSPSGADMKPDPETKDAGK